MADVAELRKQVEELQQHKAALEEKEKVVSSWCATKWCDTDCKTWFAAGLSLISGLGSLAGNGT
jgi:hypothetical protein